MLRADNTTTSVGTSMTTMSPPMPATTVTPIGRDRHMARLANRRADGSDFVAVQIPEADHRCTSTTRPLIRPKSNVSVRDNTQICHIESLGNWACLQSTSCVPIPESQHWLVRR